MTTSSAARQTAAPIISDQLVYVFGEQTDGNASMRATLGGKGANLAEMAAIGLPVPPGFTISTEVCSWYYENERNYPPTLARDISAAVAGIEKQMGKNSARGAIRCWFRSAPGRGIRCRA